MLFKNEIGHSEMIVTKPIVTTKSILFSAILFLLINLPIFATIRYVKAGNPNPIAPYTSWATASDSIQKVVDLCLSGDTILIGTGVYTELVVSISVGRYLTILGVDVDSCIIDISGYSSGIPPNPIYTRAFSLKDHLTIRNLTFKTQMGSTEHSGLVLVDNYNSVTECSISNLKFIGKFSTGLGTGKVTGKIEDCYFYGCTEAIQLDFTHSLDIIIVQNNIFQKCGYGISADYAMIRNNWLLELRSNGFDFSNLFFATEVYAYNNLLSTSSSLAWIGIWHCELGEIINNVVSGFEYGIEPYPGATIKNNVIKDSWISAIKVGQSEFNADINYNLFYNNPQISNNLFRFNPDTTIYYTADPMFENQDSNNYLLQMFSPLIDAGDPNILDVDGSRSDVGLYGGPFGQNYPYKDLAPKKPKFTLATSPPTPLLKGEGSTDRVVELHWRGGTEADFNSFSLYRSRDPLFIPDDNNKIFTGIDTLFTDSLTDPTGSYSYKLTAKDNQGNISKLDSVTVVITGVSAEEENPTPERIYLYQNYPNPFNPSTKIKFSLTEESEVILRVYDVNGELVTTLQNGWLPAGEYEREFSPKTIGTLKDIASGVYFYNLLVRDKNLIPLFVKTEKMMFIK
jgi:hypothetical protein